MKKEYKAPMLRILNVEVESIILSNSGDQPNDADAKKSGRTFEDDEDITPAAPKKFWDDEE